MSDTTLTLRELFQIDPKDVSVRAEPGIEAYQSVQNAREAIAKESRAIRWPWVRQAVAGQTRELLNLNVVDVLTEAWKKFTEIEQYADPQKHDPSARYLVPLAEHTVKSQHQPEIEIFLQGQEVASFKFDLEFSLIVGAFVLVIQNARIMEIQTGDAKGEGSLSLAGISLWKREWALVRFPGQILLGAGIPLRRAAGATRCGAA
jgi:hypothetical protein